MDNNHRNPLVIIAGPTAVGKSEAAVELAKRIGGEIISADSMQIYRGMDIGTAKIRPDQMQGIPHHLIDICDPEEAFDVTRYQQLARKCIAEISGRGHIPIVAGGTGFYIQAVLYDIDFTGSETSPSLRESLTRQLLEKGNLQLHRQLAEIDPQAAREIHPNNVRRVIRALEFYEQTGQRISEHNKEQQEKQSAYRSLYFVLTDDRTRLYERINSRVDEMMREGLLEEVRRLRQKGCTADMQSMQGLGYKELFPVLEGKCALEEAVGMIRQGSRHYAKRQLTWFKREKNCIWIDRRDYPETADVVQMMTEKLERMEDGPDAVLSDAGYSE